jgi:CDP-4-dehydro-6-deoxyglucose reductase, E3
MADSIVAFVEQIKPLTDSVLQLVLKPDVYIDYQAGQYLQIIFEQEAFSYSIANAPLGSNQYELHIRHSRDNPYYQSLFAHIKREGHVTIRVPQGLCHINRLHPDKPILFVAGGTGFAPIKAMIEQLLADGDARPFELFWGARSKSDLYMDATVLEWQEHVDHFNYFPYISEGNKLSLVDKVLEHHQNDLDHWQIVLSGPFDMVLNMRDALIAQNVLAGNLFSDAFTT